MPDIARSGFFTNFVLENPWPLAGLFTIVAGTIFWLAVQRDDRRLVIPAALVFAVAAVILAVGLLVETSGEAAADRTREFVSAASDGRIDEMLAGLDPDATLHVGRIENPGLPIEDLRRMIDALGSRHRIEQNTITLINSVGTSSDTALVELACLTRTTSSIGTVPSRWLLEWERGSGRWLVRSITAISIAGRTPTGRQVLP
ncbi:MAG: hypothetical protein O3A19_06545 [Planctomycetota bacterium]|jgi:hypothetical protein|nr:hypothetical protein [Planctomycetota bacterium]MDA1026072.1 hypothetical protein [Planctomycetota bacterium]